MGGELAEGVLSQQRRRNLRLCHIRIVPKWHWIEPSHAHRAVQGMAQAERRKVKWSGELSSQCVLHHTRILGPLVLLYYNGADIHSQRSVQSSDLFGGLHSSPDIASYYRHLDEVRREE